jgi:hypothetical protein
MDALTPLQLDRLVNRLIDIEVRANVIRRALALEDFEGHYLDDLLRAVLSAGIQLEALLIQGDELPPDLRRAITIERLLTRWDVLISEL